tara:strand:+ start:109 stop:678 length:570 start_codon:yes stop_codon:yes gene_type:complete
MEMLAGDNILSGFNIEKYKKYFPPGNNTFDTMQELKALRRIPLNKEYAKKYDNIVSVFKNTAKKHGLKKDITDLITNLVNSSYPLIMELKNFYNRPRPKVMASIMNLKMDDYEMASMKTPSYPSGHSTQGILIAKVLSHLFPELKKHFMQAGNNISDSRNIAHAHYKTDSDFGKKLGSDMYEHLKNKLI